MTELWYYAEGEEARGPLSLPELVPLLSRIADPRRVMVWRHGFEEWKAVEDVREVAQQLFRPPPLRRAPPPVPVVPTPAGVDREASDFKNVKLAPAGIGGWLGLLAFGQVVGIMRLAVSLSQYYTTLDPQITTKFPTAIWGEAALNAVFVWLCVYTLVLFFRRSRNFPRFFIWQMVVVIVFPFLDLLWIASIISLSNGRPFAEFLTLDAREGAQIITALIGAAIWIPYMLRSKRVANTFTV